MVKVSVIVPAYNAARFIKQTIDSLLNQSLKDCEFIFVNDGSTDETLKILEGEATKDNRIKIISISNSGISAARNMGLSIALGKYIFFLDADDLLINDSLGVLVDAIERNNCDVAFGKFETFMDSHSPLARQRKEIDCVFLDRNEMQKKLAQCKELSNFVWGKLFNSSLFKNYRFNNKYRVWEDIREMYKIIDLCDSGVFINEELLLYRLSQNSLSRNLTKEKINEFCIAQVDKANFYLNNYPAFARFHSESMFQCASEVVSRNYQNEIDSYDEFISTYKRIVRKACMSDKLKFFLIKHKNLYRMAFRKK